VTIEGGIFAIHSEFVSSGRGCKKAYRLAGEQVDEIISSRPALEFYLPYADYTICRR
jgi:hypothetical protein